MSAQIKQSRKAPPVLFSSTTDLWGQEMCLLPRIKIFLLDIWRAGVGLSKFKKVTSHGWVIFFKLWMWLCKTAGNLKEKKRVRLPAGLSLFHHLFPFSEGSYRWVEACWGWTAGAGPQYLQCAGTWPWRGGRHGKGCRG